MVKRITVGAHYGLRDWLGQRITAIVMAVYTLVLLGFWLGNPVIDYSAWRGLFANQAFKLLSFVALLSLFFHAWVGIRDIWMDYVQKTAIRLTLEVFTALLLIGYCGWTIHILWGMR
jgi:succinate dehydrogenase / fumarate reductase, membrane anchor subunit